MLEVSASTTDSHDLSKTGQRVLQARATRVSGDGARAIMHARRAAAALRLALATSKRPWRVTLGVGGISTYMGGV